MWFTLDIFSWKRFQQFKKDPIWTKFGPPNFVPKIHPTTKVSMCAKWFHWILSEFTSCSEHDIGVCSEFIGSMNGGYWIAQVFLTHSQLLEGLKCESKWKTAEEGGVGMRSLAHNTLRGRRACWSSGMGLGRIDKLIHSHGPAHDPYKVVSA
jgi:hypothetical protein